MREILTVYEINERYCKGNYFENLRYTPIYFDDKMITWREFECQQCFCRSSLV